MGAYVDYSFDKGFLLDEERLRRLNNLLTTRGQQFDEDSKPTYQVFRADTLTYKTTEIEEILAEENYDWQKIVRLEVEIRPVDGPELLLIFDKKSNETLLLIEGDERDPVFLLFSDVKQYMSNEVNVVWRPSDLKILMGGVTLAFSAFALSFIYSIVSEVRNPELALRGDEALASSSIQEKLDFLIATQMPGTSIPYSGVVSIILFITSISSVMILSLFNKQVLSLIDKFYPRNIFLFGDEIRRHERREKWRERIVWGIIIAVIVGVISNFVFRYLTTP